ncbi:hypothetical protein N7539_005883 [Penicillium diatomitis]|uniref:Uncharacterized protein n=1 Tax=Penicillium diatomitis TaxID=2819901 RepID=A0A9X0BTY3_9EURO|nr:uncharacterized protein N7539_005883 [Penicillium diatomitis]KAJ5484087.1 hypothetical protein N7539_005883 [Penicillium diatomitis]
MSADRSMRKRQIGVVIRTDQIPSAALPTALPELTSGSNSPSTSSVDTMSDIESVAMYGPALRRRQMSGVDFPERSAHVPELARDHGRSPIISGGSTVGRPQSQRSTSSWSTTAASQISGDPSLEEPNRRGSVDGRKEVETASFGTYICLFHPLDCHDVFEDETEWRIHVLSHFRTHPTPKTARCPICPDTEFVDQDLLPDRSSDMSGWSSTTEQDESSVFSTSERVCSAWDRMLSHVATEHYQHGQTLAGSRPDFELMRYMYGRRIITDAQFKAIQLAPAPSSPAYHRSQDGVRASIGSADEPYYAPYSRRREDRMRGQQRGVSLVL